MASLTTKTMAKGALWGILGIVFTKSMGFLYTIMLTRMVGDPSELGRFSIALGIASILLIFSDLGLGPGAVIRYVPFYTGTKEYNRVRSVLRISLIAGTIFSIFCMILLYIFSGELAAYFKDPLLTEVFYAMVFYLLVYNFYSIATGFLTGRKLMKKTNQVGNIQSFAKLFVTGALLYLFGASAVNISVGYILSFLVAALAGCYWAYREYKSLPASEEECDDSALLKEMVPFGLMFVFISSISLINSYFDRLMLGSMLPEGENLYISGIYFIVVGFASLISIFAGSFQSIYFPLISEALGRKDHASLRDTSATFIRWLITSVMPLMIVIFAFSNEVLTILYGSEYGLGSTTMMVYSLGAFIAVFSWPVQYVFSAMKKLKTIFAVTVLGAALNIILNLMLIPTHGMVGAAFASLVAVIVSTTIFLSMRKQAYYSIPKEIYKPIAAALFTIAILLAFKSFYDLSSASFLIPAVSGDMWPSMLAKIMKVLVLGFLCTIAAAIYLGFLIAFKSFHREDADIVKGGMQRIGMPKWSEDLAERIMMR